MAAKLDIAAVATILAIGFAAEVVSQPPESIYKSPSEQNGTQAGDKGNNAKPKESVLPQQTPSGTAPENKRNENRFLPKFFDFSLTDLLIAIFTIVLAIVGKKQWDVLSKTVALGKEEFEATHRPWVSVHAEIGGPLSYDDAGWGAGVRWHVDLKYRLRNVGETPATNVSFYAEIFPFTIPQWKVNPETGNPLLPPVGGIEVAKEMDRMCNFPKNMTALKMGWGQVLFPGDFPDPTTFGLNGPPNRFAEAKKTGGYSGNFLVIVCATYGSTFGNDSYSTAKAFQLFKRSGDPIDIDGETISAADLGFVPHPQQGSRAQ